MSCWQPIDRLNDLFIGDEYFPRCMDHTIYVSQFNDGQWYLHKYLNNKSPASLLSGPFESKQLAKVACMVMFPETAC